ncbi:uncharacterized protein LOC142350841 [Convolutriloba macropyga]|uniref:uncharacterized protein LOC142350841 n=1 Tax=Convolutriloba macropyga TaxID=536237 RepID=UPI003F528C12
MVMDVACVPGLSMCLDSLLGACLMQLAINWLEIASNGCQLVTDVQHLHVLVVFATVSFFELFLTGLVANNDTCNVKGHATTQLANPSTVSVLLLKTNVFFIIAAVLFIVILFKYFKKRKWFNRKWNEIYRSSSHSYSLFIPKELKFMRVHMNNMMIESCSALLISLCRVSQLVLQYINGPNVETYSRQVIVAAVFIAQLAYLKVIKVKFEDDGRNEIARK